MAETEDMAPTRATTPRRTTTAAANGAARRTRSSRAKADDLEAQVSQLQNDLRSITQTLTRMGEGKVGEVRATANRRAAELRDKGEEIMESAQDEFNALEKQIKDTIREKPLTAVAGAVALGFILAVITR
jgi:ElaB/YqjD/DUF883 family membrane-anchored ribosome-binding protein